MAGGGTGVGVGGTGVAVGGTDVAVGGSDVGAGGAGVAVAGTAGTTQPPSSANKHTDAMRVLTIPLPDIFTFHPSLHALTD